MGARRGLMHVPLLFTSPRPHARVGGPGRGWQPLLRRRTLPLPFPGQVDSCDLSEAEGCLQHQLLPTGERPASVVRPFFPPCDAPGNPKPWRRRTGATCGGRRLTCRFGEGVTDPQGVERTSQVACNSTQGQACHHRRDGGQSGLSQAEIALPFTSSPPITIYQHHVRWVPSPLRLLPAPRGARGRGADPTRSRVQYGYLPERTVEATATSTNRDYLQGRGP